MEERIGALHLHYRVRGGGLAPALCAGVDRAVQAGLGEALGKRMAAMLGDDKAVVVVKEIKTAVALRIADCTLDSRVVDCISRASSDALLALLAGDPSADSVMRFDDQAEFVASFVAALIEGSAWDRWYFGAFHRYRHANPAATLRAVLADNGAQPAAVFGRLLRRGRLPALLAHIAPHEARRMLGGRTSPVDAQDRADGSAILVEAAKRLLALLQARQGACAASDHRIAQFLAARPIAPDWTSAGSLSAWVMQLLRFVMDLPDGALPTPAPQQQDAIRALLAGPLDWLDKGWLESQLCGGGPARKPMPCALPASRRQLLTPRQERVLDQLSRSLRDGEVALPDNGGEDEIVVHLISLAASGMAGDGPLDRSIIAVIEYAVRSCIAARASMPPSPQGGAPGHGRSNASQAPARAADVIAALRSAGPSALALLDALSGACGPGREPGEASAAAGIFLLARAVTDMRLPALARQAGVPLAPLLAALAATWSGAPLSADPAIALWCGGAPGDPAGLDASGAALDALNGTLLELLLDRRILDATTAHDVIGVDAASLGHGLPCAPDTDRRLAAMACMLLRGWSHWLPGVAGSGPMFLLEKAVRRGGSVHFSDQRIVVELDPAPLDVVLRMAGYFAPIEQVEWLGERRIVFILRERAGEPAP